MPRKSRDEQRSAIAHARVTPAELEGWQAKAARAGLLAYAGSAAAGACYAACACGEAPR